MLARKTLPDLITRPAMRMKQVAAKAAKKRNPNKGRELRKGRSTEAIPGIKMKESRPAMRRKYGRLRKYMG